MHYRVSFLIGCMMGFIQAQKTPDWPGFLKCILSSELT